MSRRTLTRKPARRAATPAALTKRLAELEKIAAALGESGSTAEKTSTKAAKPLSRGPNPLRRQIAPHAIAAGLIAAGWTARAVAALTGAQLVVVALVAAVAYGTAILLAARRRSLPTRWASRIVAAGWTGATWLLLATTIGISWEMLSVLLAAQHVLAARWWQANRLPIPAPETIRNGKADAPVPETWQQYIGGPSGPIAGSRIIESATKPNGNESHTVQLSRGKHTLSSALGALDKISSGLDVPMEDLVVDAHPSRRPSLARLQVIRSSPIRETVWFDEPMYSDGYIGLGPYADGEGRAQYRLYSENSMWSGFVLGGSGSGKSRMLESIAISARSTGYTSVVWVDPQEGASSPALTDHAGWSVTGTESLPELLDALVSIVVWRSKEMAFKRTEGFTPSPDRPGILVVVDECHMAFTPELAKLWALLVRIGRKVGLGVLAVSQYPGLESFGNSETLRSTIMLGNAIVLRTVSKSSKTIMPGLGGIDPGSLPAMPGYGYTVATNPSARTAPFRGVRVDDAAAWLQRYPDIEWDELSQRAAGPMYLERHERAAEAHENLGAELAALMSGKTTINPTKQKTTVELGEQFGAVPDSVPALVLTAISEAETHSAAETVGLSRSHAAVYDAIAEGTGRTGEIVSAVGLSETRVRQILKDLASQQVIAKVAHGQYATTDNIITAA